MHNVLILLRYVSTLGSSRSQRSRLWIALMTWMAELQPGGHGAAVALPLLQGRLPGQSDHRPLPGQVSGPALAQGRREC